MSRQAKITAIGIILIAWAAWGVVGALLETCGCEDACVAGGAA